MTQPLLDFSPAPKSVTMAPSALEARRSGRQRVVSSIHTRMQRYRDLLVRFGPVTDQGIALVMVRPLSVINAIRGDWKAYAEHHRIANPVQAFDRIRQDWDNTGGPATTRTRWRWAGPR